jgi:hypothetical protein
LKWRESLQDAIRQGTSAKDAEGHKMAEDPELLHLLHTDSQEAQKSVSSEQEPDQKTIGRALWLLNAAGIRIMALEAGTAIGIWADLDGPHVREALRTLGSDGLPIRYLDGAGTPTQYKLRLVAGEPVPMSVLDAMERSPFEPWTVRDEMLRGMNWCPKGVAWETWRAAVVSRLFREQSRGNRA